MTGRDGSARSLELVRADVDVLGSLAEEAVRGAATALDSSDRLAAFAVIAADDKFDKRFGQIDQRTSSLLAGQVAEGPELRFMVAALRVMAEWRETGQLATSLANLAIGGSERDPAAVRLVRRMADITLDLVADARRAWREGDPRLAAALDGGRAALDAQFWELCSHLLDQRRSDDGRLLHHLEAGRRLQRVADLAIAVGGHVIRLTTSDSGEEAEETSP